MQAKEFGDFIILRLRNVSRRTLDHLGAKAIYFISVAYEKLGVLPQLRPTVFEAYKASCLVHDIAGQSTQINIILRSYLQQNLIEQARSFI